MSRDSTGNAAMIVHNGEELEPAICSALASMLATEPTPAEVDCAMNQLRLARDSFSLPVQTSALTTSVHASSNQWLLVAASMFIFCMCGIASTEGWAQVAKDFSDPLNEPQPLSTLADTTSNSVQQTGDMGFALRLVLIAHVTLLLLGLAGMAITWLIAIFSCFLDHWRDRDQKAILPQLSGASFSLLRYYMLGNCSWGYLGSGYMGPSMELGPTRDFWIVYSCVCSALDENY